MISIARKTCGRRVLSDVDRRQAAVRRCGREMAAGDGGRWREVAGGGSGVESCAR